MFDLGQEVICVLAEWSFIPCIPKSVDMPEKGRVYHIRGFQLGRDRYEPPLGLFLEEIVNPKYRCDCLGRAGEPAFDARAFRPVQKNRYVTDILERLKDPEKPKFVEKNKPKKVERVR